MLERWFYSGPSFGVLHEQYAKRGRTDDQAPVTSRSEIHIESPLGRVWEVLYDMPSWPLFASTFSKMRLRSQPTVDDDFSFTLNGFPINARFAVVEPEKELTWTGKALWVKAVDRLVLAAAGEGSARLSIEESFAGILTPAFMSSGRLKAQHDSFLTAVKRFVER